MLLVHLFYRGLAREGVSIAMPISLLSDSNVRAELQAAVDYVWGRVARLIAPDEQPSEHARLVYNALWLAFREGADDPLAERLLHRFFDR